MQYAASPVATIAPFPFKYNAVLLNSFDKTSLTMNEVIPGIFSKDADILFCSYDLNMIYVCR